MKTIIVKTTILFLLVSVFPGCVKSFINVQNNNKKIERKKKTHKIHGNWFLVLAEYGKNKENITKDWDLKGYPVLVLEKDGSGRLNIKTMKINSMHEKIKSIPVSYELKQNILNVKFKAQGALITVKYDYIPKTQKLVSNRDINGKILTTYLEKKSFNEPKYQALREKYIKHEKSIIVNENFTKDLKNDDDYMRKTESEKSSDFSDNGDGTVTDKITGLVVLKETRCSRAKTWDVAIKFAKGIGEGKCGLSDGSQPGDWRIPTKKELNVIKRARNNPLFPPADRRSIYYWSSSKFVDSHGEVWSTVWFVRYTSKEGDFEVSVGSKDFEKYFWLVRDSK